MQQPKHTQFDHKIILKDGQQPTFMPLRKISQEELQALEDFIEENKPKGYIYKSTSSTRYLILFILKKNSKLRLYINY